jgi:hypothetical protein
MIRKLKAAELLKSSILIAYNREQYQQIIDESSDAIIAFGANPAPQNAHLFAEMLVEKPHNRIVHVVRHWIARVKGESGMPHCFDDVQLCFDSEF